MKKLGGILPEISDVLAHIGEMVAVREAEHPEQLVKNCNDCGDTGFSVTVDFHNRMNRNYVVGRPCCNCFAGQRIAMRIAAEKELDRNLKSMGPGQTRKSTVERVKKDIEAGYRDSSGNAQF